MIGSVAIFFALHGGPQQQQQLVQQSGGQVMSKVFLRYARAESLSGTIIQTTSDGAGSVTFKTDVSYVRPGKLYVAQDRKARNGLNLLAVSDGKTFAYDLPRDTIDKVVPGERLSEPVTSSDPVTGKRTTITLGEMYAVTHSSMEPVTSLDIAIAHTPHLGDFRINVASVKLSGSVLYKGRQVYRITGGWRHYGDVQPSGQYEMLISSEYDILRYALTERYLVRGRLVDLKIVETVDLKVGAKVDDNVFKVR